MPVFQSSYLERIAREVLSAAGAQSDESRVVAEALVRANLTGTDSHGVLRIPEYVRYIEEKLVVPGAETRVVQESATFAIVDGGWGFGQVVGARAMEIAIRKAEEGSVGIVSVRNCGHIGRVGDYPLMAAERGMAGILFVNTHGAGKLTAPWGGRERRLAANPIGIAAPRKNGEPLLVDISTCAIAEGKARSLMRRGLPAPPNAILDADGNPTTDPKKFYGPPAGAFLPFGEHKGFALGLLTDILAGAISGAGCSREGANRVGNSFLGIVLNIRDFRDFDAFCADVDHLVDYVKSSKLAAGFDKILVPGEPETRERERRLRDGIPVDDESWRLIAESARKYGVNLES